jgi:UBX domain-containing protein 1/4
MFADKIEDAKAKAAIKAQIEADKRERAEKAAREKALRQGAQSLPSQPSSAPPVSSSTSGKDYKETRLQVLIYL